MWIKGELTNKSQKNKNSSKKPKTKKIKKPILQDSGPIHMYLTEFLNIVFFVFFDFFVFFELFFVFLAFLG